MTVPRTCAEQCWHAREEICRCACNGANHGCLLVNGAPIPGRTKRVKDDRFRLAAVMHTHDARDLTRELPNHYATQAVPKDCKWPEAKGADFTSVFLWVSAEVSEDQAAKEIEQAQFIIKAKKIDWHRQQDTCDGKVETFGVNKWDCPHPEAHAPSEYDAVIAAMRCDACAKDGHRKEDGTHQWHFDMYCHCPTCQKTKPMFVAA